MQLETLPVFPQSFKNMRVDVWEEKASKLSQVFL